MAGFLSFAAEASMLLPDSAYHARAAREARDGDYAFTARAFPWLYDQQATKPAELKLDELTPLALNDHSAPSSESCYTANTNESASSSSSVKKPPTRSGGLELTLHESHTGHLIGSVVWDGGKALAWVLENMHSRVRELTPDGRGFVDVIEATRLTTILPPIASSASTFTPPAFQEYLAASADGCCFDIKRDFLVGARVLELGAGTGITGLACVKLGAREVCITDIRELIPLMKENVKRNCPGTLREEWTDSRVQVTATQSISATTATSSQPAIASSTASSISSSQPTSSSSVTLSTSTLNEIPLSALYITCTNCDDLCEEAFACKICDVSLCDTCDASFHRPTKKATHPREHIGIGHESSLATSSAPIRSDTILPAATQLPQLPAECHVYVEELLWGVHSSIDSLPLALRQPFDVIIMADVVYDAYSTHGVGSDKCDNFRRLFHTLCLFSTPQTTILMTYTPRRAPEKFFFELLATEFVWECYPAQRLLPHHDAIDERIWIYHLHRTKLAGKMNAVKQRVYIHEDHYGNEVALNRARELEEKQRRQQQQQQQQSSVVASSPKSPYTSASSVTVPVGPSTTSSYCPKSHDEESKTIDASSATSDLAQLRSNGPQNITPTFTRYLEHEEDRQQTMLKAKLEARQKKKHLATIQLTI